MNAVESATLADALQYTEDRLHRRLAAQFAGPGELRSEARAVLAVAAGISSAMLYCAPDTVLDARAWERLRTIVQRRCDGEPLAYIEGVRGFHAIELQVDRHVLVPRPETELIVEAVIERAPSTEFAVADLGTGSGAIALALAHACRNARVVGVDISTAALDIARANGRRLALDVEWIASDWLEGLGGRRFEFICCNPPYIRSRDPHLEQLRHEPQIALDGGEDGLASIRRVIAACGTHLSPGGRLLLEHGFDQAAAVAQLGRAAGLQRAEILRDLAGHERVSIFMAAE